MQHSVILPFVVNHLKKAKFGSLTLITPTDKTIDITGKEKGPCAILQLHSWRALTNLLLGGGTKAAGTFQDNLWSTPDLEQLLRWIAVNELQLRSILKPNWFVNTFFRFRELLRRNTITGSRRNISYHYDLGNDFYELWLDPTMTYSSALYDGMNISLQSAQQKKNRRILDFLDKPGRILEVGCGWGGFGEQAIQEGDHSIDGITISKQQFAYATNRLKDLGKQSNIIFQDYRNMEGLYDYIVSIEMFEAVGEQYWSTYFNKISALLRNKGKAVIQIITIAESRFTNYRKSTDFIRSYVFPGGMLAPESIIRRLAAEANLLVTDVHHFPKDYALTLRTWRKRFNKKSSELIKLGYDMPLQRLWNMYLASCAISFDINNTSVIQLSLQKP